MLTLLCLTLVIMLLIVYKINKVAISPAVIALAIFWIIAAFSVLFQDYLNLEISITTYLYIVIAMIVFSIGTICFSRYTVENIKKDKYHMDNYVFFINDNIAKVYFFIGIIILYIFMLKMIALVESVGGFDLDFSTLLHSSRDLNVNAAHDLTATVNEQLYPIWVKSFFLINDSITYACLYGYIHNKVFEKNNQKMLLVPFVLYLLHSFLLASRILILTIFDFIFTVYTCLYLYRNGIKKLNKKIQKIVCCFLHVGLVIFFVIGCFRADGTFDLTHAIFAYGGSEIPAFDKMLNGDVVINNTNSDKIFSFYGLYYSLAQLGLYNGEIPDIIWNATYFNNQEMTNVYTAFSMYVFDFGIAGSLLLIFLLGCILGKISGYMINYKKDKFMLICYAILIHGVYFLPITEELLTRMTLSWCIKLFLIYVVYRSIRNVEYDNYFSNI